MKKLKIFVCTHKEDSQIRNYEPFVPVHGGKALHLDIDLGYMGDNTGDNISERNPLYSEWSVIYWAWKNSSDAEYIGLNHYRRYFKKTITDENVEDLIGGADMIAVRRTNKSKCSRLADLAMMTSQEDAYLFADSVLSVHPDSKKALLKYLYDSTESFPYSMFIMRKELFEDYCNFIFPVLFDLEKRIKPHGYSRQQRTMGYFGEYSLGLFIYYRNLKVKGIELVGADELTGGIVKKVMRGIRNFCYRIGSMESLRAVPKDVIVPDVIKTGLRNDNISLRSLR